VKKISADLGSSSVDSDPGFLGSSVGSEPGSFPAQPETSSVAFLSVSGDSAIRQLGSFQKFVSPINSRFTSPPLFRRRGNQRCCLRRLW
jgi:hypothetical protein